MRWKERVKKKREGEEKVGRERESRQGRRGEGGEKRRKGNDWYIGLHGELTSGSNDEHAWSLRVLVLLRTWKLRKTTKNKRRRGGS